MELRRKLGILMIVSAVLLTALLLQISKQQSEKIYGETTTVIGKNYSFVERYYFYPIGSPAGDIWRRSSHRGIFWVHKITTSSGNEYEILLKEDWDLIQENDVVKQYTGDPYTVERGNGLYYETTYAPIPGTLCWLELWRNETYLKNMKAYKPP